MNEEEKSKLKEKLWGELQVVIDKYFVDVKDFDIFMLMEVLEETYFSYLEEIRDQAYEDEGKGEEVYPFLDGWTLTMLIKRLAESSSLGVDGTIGALETAKQMIFSEWSESHKNSTPVNELNDLRIPKPTNDPNLN